MPAPNKHTRSKRFHPPPPIFREIIAIVKWQIAVQMGSHNVLLAPEEE